MREWTDAQKAAIEARDESLIISAAAGAGKTAVLVERVIQKVLNGGQDIDRLLIVTFTNASASEMRERIYGALAKELATQPENEHLQRQIAMLPRANICTIHAFCQNLLRKYFYLLGISAAFKIADENKLAIMKAEIIDKVLASEYESNNTDFEELVRNFGGRRGDEEIAELVQKIHNFSQSAASPSEWLRSACDTSDERMERYAEEIFEQFALDLAGICAEYDNAIRVSIGSDGLEKYGEHLHSESEYFKRFRDKVEKRISWDELYEEMQKFAFANMPRKGKDSDEDAAKKVQGLRKNIKDIYAKYAEGVFYADFDRMKRDMEDMRGQIACLCGLVQKFDDEYMLAKRSENLLDFNDLEHFAIDVLNKNAEEVARNFDEVYIDEFQDTNSAQARIFDSLGAHINTFVVGDVKQSIYRFRNAEPRIFLSKIKGERGRLINLSHNFRSNSGIIDDINRIFSRIMSRKVGEVEYDESHSLISGKMHGNSDKTQTLELHLLEKKIDNPDELTSVEREARFVASKILDIVKKEKTAKYGDITILSRKSAGVAKVFAGELVRAGIPVICDDNSGFFASNEIETMLAFLKIIDNQLQDIPLLAIMRSAIYGFTDDEFAEMRLKTPMGLFYEAVKNFESDKSEQFLAQLREFINVSKTASLAELLEKIIVDTHYEAIISAMPNSETRLANLQLLRQYAANFEADEYKSLFDFIGYVSACIENKQDFGTSKAFAESENAVRIMTIHKSKGLEFRVVFLVGCGMKFNMRDVSQSILYDFRRGIGMDYINSSLHFSRPTIAKTAISLAKKEEMLSEEMRVLYVALTRAIEKIVVTASISDIETHKGKWKNNSKYYISRQNTFVDWLGIAGVEGVEHREIAEVDSAVMSVDSGQRTENKVSDEIANKIREKLEFKLPEIGDGVPTKLSVSEILNKDLPTRLPEFVADKGVTAAHRGSVVHFVMQNLDLGADCTRAEVIEQQLDIMQDKGMINTCDRGLVDAQKVSGFFRSELGKRIKKAYAKNEENVQREVKFFLEEEERGEKFLLQGVVDCYFEEDGEIVIIDFKTGEKAAAKPQSAEQVKIYSMALERILGKNVKECYAYGGL